MNLVALCAAMVVGVFSLQGIAQDLARAEKPEAKVGDTWTMRNRDANSGADRPSTTITVTSVTSDTIVTLTGSQTYTTRTRDLNHLETKVGDRVTSSSSPAWVFYQFPLQAGKKWDGRWETTSDRQITRWTGKAEVEKVETITVPAGTFQAFKVKFEGTYNARSRANSDVWTGFRNETAWYAPDVRRVVKTEWEERSGSYYNKEINELMSFKLVP